MALLIAWLLPIRHRNPCLGASEMGCVSGLPHGTMNRVHHYRTALSPSRSEAIGRRLDKRRAVDGARSKCG